MFLVLVQIKIIQMYSSVEVKAIEHNLIKLSSTNISFNGVFSDPHYSKTRLIDVTHSYGVTQLWGHTVKGQSSHPLSVSNFLHYNTKQ